MEYFVSLLKSILWKENYKNNLYFTLLLTIIRGIIQMSTTDTRTHGREY